jgi:hypothetical protein
MLTDRAEAIFQQKDQIFIGTSKRQKREEIKGNIEIKVHLTRTWLISSSKKRDH